MTSYVLFKVLLCHSQFLKPLFGQITQLQIIKTQKISNYPIFCLFSQLWLS